MIVSNNRINDDVPKAGSNDKMLYGSIADCEIVSLIGGREDKSVKNLAEKMGLSRLGSVGFLVAFLVLSSAASMLFMNRNEGTGVTARVGLLSTSASSSSMTSSSTPEGIVHYTNGGFSGGIGHPIFVIEGSTSCKPNIFQGIMDEAKELGAYIIAGDYGTAVLKTIKAIRDELECNPDDTNPDYCIVMTFNCGSMEDTKVSVNMIDYQNNFQNIANVETKNNGNSMIEIMDIIGDFTGAFDLLARQEVSDGPLQPPVVLEPVEEISRGECRGATWTDPKTKVYHLTMEVATHATVAAEGGKFRTRTMNGRFFGPLIKIKRGETFRVFFNNTLEDIPDLPYEEICDNQMCKPNYSNLHYHGAHVSGEEPSDDVELSIGPGECYNYESYFPENHMPGTHWIHPHYHGSTTIQVGGGASLPFIVEDDPDTFPIPPEVEAANDVLLFVQTMRYRRVDRAILIAYGLNLEGIERDHFQFRPRDSTFNQFRTINGQYRPTLKIKTGEWNRFRVIYAGWDDSVQNLDWKISHPECEQYLLAKDGIYIKDYPRKLDYFPVPAAGRADIMVRCNAPGTFKVTHTYEIGPNIHLPPDEFIQDEELMIIESEGPPVESPEPLTENFDWQFPPYLQDVIDEPVLMGKEGNCSCLTNMEFSNPPAVNGVPFEKHTAIHTIEFGQVVERELKGMSDHPYHQHVYPFQLTGGFDPDDEVATQNRYFLNGDWHDNIRAPKNKNRMFIKYKASVHEGKVMLHCHRLWHEDYGMMSQEYVSDDHKCSCDVFYVTK